MRSTSVRYVATGPASPAASPVARQRARIGSAGDLLPRPAPRPPTALRRCLARRRAVLRVHFRGPRGGGRSARPVARTRVVRCPFCCFVLFFSLPRNGRPPSAHAHGTALCFKKNLVMIMNVALAPLAGPNVAAARRCAGRPVASARRSRASPTRPRPRTATHLRRPRLFSRALAAHGRALMLTNQRDVKEQPRGRINRPDLGWCQTG